MQSEKYCFVCGTTYNLHKHHIYKGVANRRLSEKEGCWCYLCYKHHNGSDRGVHFNKILDGNLKMFCQEKWEDENPDRDFVKGIR